MKKKGAKIGLNSLKVLGLVLFLSMILTNVFPTVVEGGNANEYTTIVLTKPKIYEIGEEVTLEIRFYNKDTLVDAEDINITLTLTGKYIEVDEENDKIATGVYQVKFTIEEEDDPWGMGMIMGDVNCTKSGKYDISSFLLLLEMETFRTKVRADKHRFNAGDTVRFSVEFTNGTENEKVDPDNYEATIRINGVTYQDIMLTKDDVGEYHYDYVSSSMDTESKEVKVDVDADYQDYQDHGDDEANLNYYQIWLYSESTTDSELTGDIGVCDMDGNPLELDVELTYSYEDDKDGQTKKTVNGMTGSDGLMDITLDYADMDEEEEEIDVTIWGNDTNYQQYAHEIVKVKFDFREPEEEGFDVVSEIVGDMFMISTNYEMNLEYTAYYDGEPLGSKEIYYYYYPHPYTSMMGMSDEEIGEVYLVDMATTDNDGKFSVPFTAPDKNAYVNCMFKADFGGKSGEGDWEFHEEMLFVFDWFGLDPDMTVDVSNFGLGKKATVDVTREGQNGGEGGVMISPVDTDITESDLLENMFGEESNDDTWIPVNTGEINEENFTGDSFSRDFGVPSFFPEEKYFAIVGVMTEDVSGPMMDYKAYWGYLVVDKDGNPQDISENKLKVNTDAPGQLESEEEREVTITVTGSGPIEGVDVFIDVTGSGYSNPGSGVTDENGELTFTLYADNVSGEDETLKLWINATKDEYEDGKYTKTITVKKWDEDLALHVSTDAPEELESEEAVEITIWVTDDNEDPAKDADVTIETTGSGNSNISAGKTDENGELTFTLTADTVTEDETVTIWINATKVGYEDGHYEKTITVKAPVEDDEYEENDIKDDAAEVDYGDYGDLSCQDDDWYKIYLDAGDDIYVIIDGGEADIDLFLYDEEDNQLDSSEGLSGEEDVSANDVSEGWYYIQVYFISETTSYDMDISEVGIEDDEYEENDIKDEAAEVDYSLYEDLYCEDDDWYKIYLNNGDDIYVTIDGAADIDLYLYDEEENELDSSEGLGGEEEVSTTDVTEGWYYIQVYFFFDTTSYDMNITEEGPAALHISTDALGELESEEEVEVTITVTGSGPIEDAYVSIDTGSGGNTDTYSGYTDENGELKFNLTADNATDDDLNFLLWIDATKDGYEDGHYQKSIIVKAWNAMPELEIETDAPDMLNSEQEVDVIITVTGSGPIEGVYLEISTYVGRDTSIDPTSGYTDENGQLTFMLTAAQTDEDFMFTLFINASKEGYENGSYDKRITVKAPTGPMSYVTGKITDSSDNPIKDIEVELWEMMSTTRANSGGGNGGDTERTDSDGIYNITAYKGDFILVTNTEAGEENNYEANLSEVTLNADETKTVNVKLGAVKKDVLEGSITLSDWNNGEMGMVREFGESSLMRFQLDRYLGNGNGKLETSEIDAWIKLMKEPDDEDGDEDFFVDDIWFDEINDTITYTLENDVDDVTATDLGTLKIKGNITIKANKTVEDKDTHTIKAIFDYDSLNSTYKYEITLPTGFILGTHDAPSDVNVTSTGNKITVDPQMPEKWKENVTITFTIIKPTITKKEITINGATVSVIAAIKGDGDITVKEIDSPDPDDNEGIGIYLDIELTGGELIWLNITINYKDLPEGVKAEDLKIYYWKDNKWMVCEKTGVDTANKLIWANVTHLTIFAPRSTEPVEEEEDDGDSKAILVVIPIIIIIVIIIVFMMKGKKQEPTSYQTTEETTAPTSYQETEETTEPEYPQQ